MSDEPDADAWDAEIDPDEEPTDGARIEEFLDRLEDTDLGDDQASGRSPADEPERGGGSTDETDAEGIPPETTDIGQERAGTSEPTFEQSSSETDESGGRLWDSFDSDEGDGGDPGKPSNEPPAEETTAPSATSATDARPGGRTEPDGATGPEPRATADDSDPNAADEPSSSSFTTILKRISNRINPTSSATSAEGSTEPTSSESVDDGTAGSTAAGAETAESVKSNQPASGGTTAGTVGTDTTGGSRSGAQDSIDQILNTIDRFGRATSSSQILVLSPTAHSITNEIYRRALLPADGTGQDVLFVSATQTVGDQLDATRLIPDWTEGKTAVIEVGQGGLKPTGPDPGPDVTQQLDVYKRMSKLQHLAKLGVNISHIVSQWNDSHRPTVVGVHTLSAVQQYVGTETMFQFLFTLEGQLNSLGVMGFYHMDPSVHTDNEISTITQAFDLVIRVSSDGTVDIE